MIKHQYNFQAVAQVLRESLDFLQQPCKATPLVERGGHVCAVRAAHALQRLQALQSERPSLLSVLVVGEFNAGKSTLINALLGKTVAAVDVLEMTHAVCRIVPTTVEPETVYLTAPGSSLPPLTLSLQEFVRRSQARVLDVYTQAVAYVQTPLDIVLIDTPGLGASRQHEKDAVETIAASDVVLYVVDAEGLGNARDVALIQHIGEIKLPMLCALTKIDILADDELPVAVDYLSDQLGIPANTVFPVCAQQTLQAPEAGGVERLHTYLADSVIPRRETLREESLCAQAGDIATEVSICYLELKKQLNTAIQNVEGYRQALQTTADAVTMDLSHYLAERLRSEFRLKSEQMLFDHLRQATTTEQEIKDVLDLGLSKEKQREFVEQMQTHLGGRFQQDWAEGIRANAEVLKEALETMKTQADQGATKMLEEIAAQEELKKQSISSVLFGVAAGVGGALLGGVTLGFTVSVPILFMAYTKWQQSGTHTREQREQELMRTITQWREETIEIFVSQRFLPKIAKINHEVVEQASDSYAQKQLAWPLTQAELREWLYSVDQGLQRLIFCKSI